MRKIQFLDVFVTCRAMNIITQDGFMSYASFQASPIHMYH